MLYFDTSILLPLLVPEASSPRVVAFFASLPSDGLAISLWTRLELSSALARMVRMGRVGAAQAAAADADFRQATEPGFSILTPTGADFERARQFLGHYDTGLRSGDALHLAIAANNRAEMLYSLDQGLVRAASLLGVPASLGIE